MLKKKKRLVANCHRRFGKGTTVLTYVCERAHTEKITIRYGAPTQKQAYEILETLIDHIYKYAPQMAPKLKDGDYVWPSGSVMHVFGVKDSGEADKARGTEADIIICDEYGFWRYKPSYILKSVLSPQLDDTDGQLIITSTPPEDMTHPFITEELAQAEAQGNLFRWDLGQSLAMGEISKQRHVRIIERCGGEDTDAYKREYLLDLVANKSRLVIPEAQEESYYIGSQDRPFHYFPYFCCDLGLSDFFHGIFGYVDFKQARLICEREYCANYQSTGEISMALKRIEQELAFMNMNKIRRLGDSSDPQQLFDMSKDHDYYISPIHKRSKMNNVGFRDSVLNGLRIAIKQARILISKEGCPTLCSQLKYGLWNEKRTDFERSEALGHLDGLMALAYMWDNVDISENPYPALAPGITEATHYIDRNIYPLQPAHQLRKLVSR